MKCPHCQAENRDEAQFCGECGQSLQSETTCPQCGYANTAGRKFCDQCGNHLAEPAPAPASTPSPPAPPPPEPASFANGRYQVKRPLGEGGMKRVYLAYDTKLDRDVAFSIIEIERLDDVARTRVSREAQAMGRLGSHPSIVIIHDMGEQEGQPYLVTNSMEGGGVERLIAEAPKHRQLRHRSCPVCRCR